MKWRAWVTLLRAVALLFVALPPAHADRTITLPAETLSAYEETAISVGRGDVRRDAGAFDEAEKIYVDALARFERLSESHPDSTQIKRGVWIVLTRLNDVQWKQSDELWQADGRWDQETIQRANALLWAGRASAERALVIARDMVRMSPTSLSVRRDLSNSLILVGDARRLGGRNFYAEAADILEDLAKMGAAEPGDTKRIADLRQRSRY